MMDEETKNKMSEDIDAKIEAMGESTMMIAAGNGVKQEYQALGANVDDIQTQYIFTSQTQKKLIFAK